MIEFSGKLTKEDLNDLAVLLRPKGYWFSFLLETWHGAALFGLIAWATVSAFLGRTSPHWPGLAVIWLVIAGIVIWTAYTVRRDRQRDLARLNATLPERVQLTTEGVRWAASSGGLASLPWAELVGWRERGRVIAIDNRGGAAAVFFSVAEMPELERQRLRDFLRAQVPPAPSLPCPLDRTG